MRAAGQDGAVRTSRLLYIPLGVAILVSLVVLIASLNRPLIDQHGFRQAQTAISVWWMLHGGRWWDYETPVLGAGWSVPFEFPLFQWIVAIFVRAFGVPLDAAGRLVSYFWLICCIPSAAALVRSYRLPASSTLCFAILLLASPVYLFWGRAFLLETQAVALGFLMLAAFHRFLLGRGLVMLAIALLASIAVCLTKITTALSFLALAGLMTLVTLRQAWSGRRGLVWLLAGAALVGLTGPILFEMWTRHADALKSANPLTAPLASTSPMLTAWNFGTLQQRFSVRMVVALSRSIIDVGGLIAPLLLGIVVIWYFRGTHETRARTGPIIVALLVGWFLPYAVFANLHVKHNYYQAGNAALLIAALAVAIGSIAERTRPTALLALLAALMVSQYARFATGFLPSMREGMAARDYAVGRLVGAHAPAGSVVFATGLDWSSVMPYYAERRAILVTDAPPRPTLLALFADPARFTGGLPIGAIVRCPSPLDDDPVLAGRLDRLIGTMHEQGDDIGGCHMYVADRR